MCDHESHTLVGQLLICDQCAAIKLDPLEVCERIGHDDVNVEGTIHCTRCGGFKYE